MLVFLSVLLINVDTYTRSLVPVRALLEMLVMPLQQLVLVPEKFSRWVSNRAISEPELLEKLDLQRQDNLRLIVRLQKMEALDAENRRLRELLLASRRGLDRVMLAEIEDISLEPFTQSVLINRGLFDDVYEGQPVLDSHGVMGQVVRTSYMKSAVSLVTDPGQTIPVMVQRNGLRALTSGTGSDRILDVPYLDRNTDIRKGDHLVTSGMGGHFPYGYPVAQVIEVAVDVNEPFLQIKAEPVARLGFSREVLLVWPGSLPEEVVAPEKGPEDTVDATSGRQEVNDAPRQ